MTKLTSLLAYILILSQYGIAHSNEIIAIGTPIVKIESGFQGTSRVELDSQQCSEYLVVIEYDGHNLQWKTREKKVLKLNF